MSESTESTEINAANLTERTRRILIGVAALNLAGLIIELIAALIIGSASLLADAADFLEDFLINVLVITASAWPLRKRIKASYGLVLLMLIPAVSAFVMAGYKIITGTPPEGLSISIIAVIAMVINLSCALLLLSVRSSGSMLVRGAWLSARNDVLANVLILCAGIITMFWFSIWPDVVMGIIIGAINLTAAKEVWEQTRAEVPELESDD